MGIPILGFFWAGYNGHNMEITWAITRAQFVGLPHGLVLKMIRAISYCHHLGAIIWVYSLKHLGHPLGAFCGLSNVGFKSESSGPFHTVMIWVASYGYNLLDSWAIIGGLLVGCTIWVLN